MKYRLFIFEEIYGLCVKNNYYTCGTNKDYDNLLFSLIKIDTCINQKEYIYNIALDIFYHSHKEDTKCELSLQNIVKQLKNIAKN